MNGSTRVIRREGGIGFTRVYEFSPSVVFGAFANARKLALWWGPPECPIVECSLDFRPRGIWHYRLLSSRSGQDVWSRAVFEEIVPDSRIVFVETSSNSHGAITLDRLPAHTTVTFTPYPGGTLLTVDITYTSADEASLALERGVERGFTRGLDQLDLLLRTNRKELHP
jgi:uncharacterized protein YndB with AHSA1/START domain